MTSGCTSFALHNEFLLLTTTAHVLRFVSLSSEPQGNLTSSVHFVTIGKCRLLRAISIVPYSAKFSRGLIFAVFVG